MVAQPANENRTFIEFTNWKRVFKVLEMFVGAFLKTEDFVNQTDEKTKDNVDKETVCLENITPIGKDNEVGNKSIEPDEDALKKQEERKDLENESFELVNDYSLKMVEHFQEHTRKPVEREIIRDVERVEILNLREESTFENVDVMRPTNKENDNGHDEVAKIVKDDSFNQIEPIDPAPQDKVSTKDQSKENQVTSLRSKIKLMKEEVRKTKESKKISTSFHSKRKMSLPSKEKIAMDVYKQDRRDQNTKYQKNIQGCENHNKIELGEQERMKYGRGPIHKIAPSVFSNETVKNWTCSTEKSNKRKKEISNESILTQMVFLETMKNSKKSSHESKGEGVTSNESILTGVNTFELAKHFKSVQETRCEYNFNETNGGCNFGKLYKVCNLNLFQRFESNDCLNVDIVDHTPNNLSKIELTPIKVRRKNRRREAKKTVDQRKEYLNEVVIDQQTRHDQRNTTREDITKNESIIQNRTRSGGHPLEKGDRKKILDKKRDKLGIPCKDTCNSKTTDIAKKITHKMKALSLPKSKQKNHSKPLHVRPIAREYIDTFHYNPVIANESTRATIKTGHSPSHHDHKRKASHSKTCIPKKHVKPNALKVDRGNLKNVSKSEEHTKQICRCKKCYKKSQASEKILNLDDKLVPYEDSPDTFEMFEEREDTVANIDEYVNDVLSRSYRLDLHMDSQEHPKDMYHERQLKPYVYNVQESFGEDSVAMRSPCRSNSRRLSFESPDNQITHQHSTECVDYNQNSHKKIKCQDDPSTTKLNLGDIWEDSTKQGQVHNLSLSESISVFPGCTSSKRHFPQPKIHQATSNGFQHQDVHITGIVPFSPYFKRSKLKENSQSKTKYISSNENYATDETLINNLEGEVRVVMPKWNDKKLILDSSFFRKRFNLTPVLQSSNSNNQHSDEPQLNNEKRSHEEFYRNAPREQFHEYHGNTAEGGNYSKEVNLNQIRREQQETLSYHCYQNQQDDYHDKLNLMREDVGRGADMFFDEEIEDNMNENMNHDQNEGKEEEIQILDLTKSSLQYAHSNPMKSKQGRSFNRAESRKYLNPKICQNLKETFKNTENVVDTVSPSTKDARSMRYRINCKEQTNCNLVDGQLNDKTNTDEKDDNHLYEIYRNNITKWLTPKEQERCENFGDISRDQREKFLNLEGNADNCKRFENDPNNPNEDFDDTERMFEEYRKRNFTQLNENNEDVGRIEEIDQDNVSMGDSYGELIIDEGYGNNIDEMVNMNIDSNEKETIPINIHRRDTNQHKRNSPTNSPLADTVPFENTKEPLDTERDPTYSNQRTINDSLALAETEIYQNTETHLQTVNNNAPTSATQIMENTKTVRTVQVEIHNDKTIMETAQEAEVHNDVPADNQMRYAVTEILGENLVFNRLGLVESGPKKTLPPESGFRLKDRYGFMHKGLSPLVLPQQTSDLGVLETSELQQLEGMLPSPLAVGVGDNVVDKIVNMEEIGLRSSVKNSLLNTMCHVTKDLLNVTFKVSLSM